MIPSGETMAEVKGMNISWWIAFVFIGRLSNLVPIANRRKETSCRYLMTWKNVLNIVPSVKKKASSFPQFSMWSPIATLSGCISAEKKSLKRCIPTCSPCLFFVWCSNGAFYFFILLIHAVWIFLWQTCIAFVIRKKVQHRFLFLKTEHKSKQLQIPAASMLGWQGEVQPLI